MAKHEEVELILRREVRRFEDVALLACKPEVEDGDLGGGLNPAREVTVKAPCNPGELVEGLTYRFFGSWIIHPKYGRQFHARTFVMSTPHSRAGTIRYLMLAPGVGQIAAQKLWDKFGSKSVKVLREDPDLASEVVGGTFNETKAKLAAAELQYMKGTESVTIDLMELLSGRGFSKQTGKSAVEEWGNRAAEVIRKNPFRLLVFPGCGFLRCDQLYQDLGLNPARLKRQALCAHYEITQASQQSGSVWFHVEFVERKLSEKIGSAQVQAFRALKCAKRAKLIRVRHDQGSVWIANAATADNEAFTAQWTKATLTVAADWPNPATIDASEHQKAKASQALIAPISVITGGPGTGKTYLASRIVHKALETCGIGSLAVAAPTGKAAVRISEVMAGYGIPVKATTIHSLLKVASSTRSGGWTFQHNESDPLPYRYVLIDEASMLDTALFASLCRACAKGTHLLLVGDVGQLPPVGPGAPLRDLIAAGVPTGELTEIRRNSGQIVKSCHEIRAGSAFTVSPILDPEAGHNLFMRSTVHEQASVEQIVRIIRRVGSLQMFDPIWEVQVIVAVNEKSALSRRELNCKLQNELNPGGERADGNPFRVKDKVICLRNGFFRVVDDAPDGFNTEVKDGNVFIANGEQGEVKHVEPQITIVQLSAPDRLVRIFAGGDNEAASGAWDLAYAISCHKSQGSEWPIVLVAIDEYPGARMICSREWIYTAISRAKVACGLVGKLGTAQSMVIRQAIQLRKTFLVEQVTR